MDDPTDAELLAESRRRPDAFVELARRHAVQLRAWLRAETGDDEVAADLLAETLAQAWRSRRRYRDPGSGSAGPWLQGIARNLVAGWRRDGAIESRARRRLGLPVDRVPDRTEEVDERLSVPVERAALAEGLRALPAEQRDALALRVVGELDYAEVGARLGVPEATARTRVFRALGALRRRLDQEGRE